VPAEFLVIPESAIHHDDATQTEEAEPPRLFSAAVHPTPNLQNDTLTADAVPDIGLVSNSLPRAVDPANQFGTDSPRRLGRSRTDTMVFSEAYSVAEELPKSEASSGSLLGTSPVAETQSLLPEPSWPDLQTSTEDSDDEDIGDTRSDLTLAAPLSPPVDELPLISLEDTPSVAPPDEAAPQSPSEPSQQGPPSDAPAIESGPEESNQVVNPPEENAPTDEPSISEVVESASEEVDAAASEALTESTQIPPGPEESVAESITENVDPIPLSNDEEPEGTAPPAESEVSPPPQPLLELNEPPPSEPIPPESESDITDEVGGLDGDEVQEGGEEEEAVVCE
jgi:hypothetical protein